VLGFRNNGKMGDMFTHAVPAEDDRFSRLFLCGSLARALASTILKALSTAPCEGEINSMQGELE
jgi:hypothetical protein